MKTHALYTILLALGTLLMSCEKNDQLPDYEKVGTSTATIAEISLSNDAPLAGEAVTVTMYYVNLTEDPAQSIELLVNTGDGNFTELTTLDETSSGTGEEITKTFTYTVPALEVGTSIDLDMLLYTGKEFPQRERATLEVTAAEE